METFLNNKPKIIVDFILYILNIKNYSLNTAQNYCTDLVLFFKFIKEYHDIPVSIFDFNVFVLSDIGKEDIYAFLVYLNFYRDNLPSSRKCKLNSIKGFYKWLFMVYKIGKNKNNPADNINITQMQRLPKYLSLEYTKKIINVFNKKNSRYPTRDNLIIALFLNCGLRVSELINIEIKDINFYDNSLSVVGKGNKQRKVYLNKYIKDILYSYIYSIKSTSQFLFTSNRNNKLSIDRVESICKKAYKLVGLENYKYTVHSLRHTAATLMYQYGNVDIKVIKEFLGHESILSTEIYTHIHSNTLKNAVDNNPLNFI